MAGREGRGQQHEAEAGEREAPPLTVADSTPKSRWAITPIITTPPASTTWTTEIGASASAATWKIHALVAIAMPMANHFDA